MNPPLEVLFTTTTVVSFWSDGSLSFWYGSFIAITNHKTRRLLLLIYFVHLRYLVGFIECLCGQILLLPHVVSFRLSVTGSVFAITIGRYAVAIIQLLYFIAGVDKLPVYFGSHCQLYPACSGR